MVSETVKYDNWICRYYHENASALTKHQILYRKVVRVH